MDTPFLDSVKRRNNVAFLFSELEPEHHLYKGMNILTPAGSYSVYTWGDAQAEQPHSQHPITYSGLVLN